MRRRSSFLEALMKDALALINKMKQKLKVSNMRLAKEAIRIAKRKDLKVSFWSPEQGGLICVCYIHIYIDLKPL